MLFDALKSLHRINDSNSFEELIGNSSHFDTITIHQAEEEDFYNWDKFHSRSNSNIIGKIKDEYGWETNSKGLKGQLGFRTSF